VAAGLVDRNTHHPWKYSPCARFCTGRAQGSSSSQTAGLIENPLPACSAHHKGAGDAQQGKCRWVKQGSEEEYEN